MQKLTDLGVANIKPRGLRFEIADSVRPGLRLIVQPSGVKSWAVRYRHAGKQHKVTLGTLERLKLADARAAAREVLRQVAAGKNPVAMLKAEREREAMAQREATLADEDLFENRWQEYTTGYIEENLWHSTAKIYKRIGETYLKPEFTGTRINDISQYQCSDLFKRTKKNRGPQAANRVYSVLRHFFSWFEGKEDKHRRRILPVSPMHGIAKPAPEVARKRVLDDDELRWFWKACDGEDRIGKMLKLILLTATRRDETRCMMEREVNTRSNRWPNLWTIPGARTKNGLDHEIPMAPAAVEILQSVPRVRSKAGFIFTTTGETAMSGLSKVKARIAAAMLALAREEAEKRGDDPAAIEIPNWRIHDLRRTARTRLSKLRIDHETAERCVNHVKQSGLEFIYNQDDFREQKKEAFERLADHILSVVGQKPANIIPLANRRGQK